MQLVYSGCLNMFNYMQKSWLKSCVLESLASLDSLLYPTKKCAEWVQELRVKQIISNVRESWHDVVPYVHIILERVITPRGTRYCWAWYKQSFETNKLTMFLETESAYPYCNWSIKMVRIIWLGPTSVDIGPAYVNHFKRLGRPKIFQKNLVQVRFASVFASSSASPGSPLQKS